MTYSQVDRDPFYLAVDSITYRLSDVKEAIEFGCTDIRACYTKANHRYAKYFIVYDALNVPVVTVMLQRDGHIIFFISDTINNPTALIRVLKKLANKVTRNCGAIITKTAYWYTEAQRLNKIMGFKEMTLFNYYGLYVKE